MIDSDRRSSARMRQHLAVVVAALALDGRGVAGQRADLVGRQLLQPLQVDDDLRGRLGAGRDPALGEQLGYRNAVEVGQLGQLLHGDRAVAALVGARPRPPSSGRRTSARRRAATTPAAAGWRGACRRAPWRSRPCGDLLTTTSSAAGPNRVRVVRGRADVGGAADGRPWAVPPAPRPPWELSSSIRRVIMRSRRRSVKSPAASRSPERLIDGVRPAATSSRGAVADGFRDHSATGL